MNADSADIEVFLENAQSRAESRQYSLEQAAGGIGFHLNRDKTEFMSFNQKGDISTLNGHSLKLVDKFTYLVSSVSSTDNEINIQLAKVWIEIDRLSDVSDKIKKLPSSGQHYR